MKSLNSLLLGLLLCSSSVNAIDMGELQEFVEVIGYDERIDFSVDYYKSELRKNYPSLPAEFWSNTFVELESWYRREAMEAIVQSYATALSSE